MVLVFGESGRERIAVKKFMGQVEKGNVVRVFDHTDEYESLMGIWEETNYVKALKVETQKVAKSQKKML